MDKIKINILCIFQGSNSKLSLAIISVQKTNLNYGIWD